MAEETEKAGVECWGYCLMPNHVHLILTPRTAEGLGRAIGEAHRRYAGFVNRRMGWTGHLFQGRFASAPMDDGYLMAALGYVAMNPVRAGLVDRAEAWPWSSTRAHLAERGDVLVRTAPVSERGWDFKVLLLDAARRSERLQAIHDEIRASQTSGRPLGSRMFIANIERRLGRPAEITPIRGSGDRNSDCFAIADPVP